MATESFEIINDSLSWPTRLSRTRVSSVQGLSLSETPSLASLSLDDVLRTVQRLGLKRCLYGDIENLIQVGEGETFRVDKCIYDKQTVAVKHLKLGASQKDNHGLDSRLRAVLSEIRIMYHDPLREHPNILSILGYGWRQSGPGPMPYVVVEYAMFGSLRQYLAESERSLRTKIIMAGDIAAGLNALHQCDIVHGDLKLDNVVVLQSWDRPPGAIAKICDFGHAIVLSGDKRYQKYYGTALYNPPEVECQDLSPIDPIDLPKCDMWAYGLALWEIFQNGAVFFNKGWRDEIKNQKACQENSEQDTDVKVKLPSGASADFVSNAPIVESEESARTIFGRFDPRHLAKLATDFINNIEFGGGFVDKAILRKFLNRALQIDPQCRPSKITLGPLMSIWNPADVSALRAKLSIHTGSAGWSFNLLRPDQEKEIMWEHQLQILHDFEQISKRQRSPDGAAAAAFQVAMCYLAGFGTQKDLRAAANFIQEAEERKHPAAKLLGPTLQSETSRRKQFNGPSSYDRQIINGFKAMRSLDPTASLTVQWKTLDSKPLDPSQGDASRDLPPQYERLTSGDIIEYSTATRLFSNYPALRSWLTDSAKNETEPFLITPETSVTSVSPSLKANLLELAIILEDKLLIADLSRHISLSTMGYLGELPLITACRTGNMGVLRACLAGEPNLFEKQPDGSTFLHWVFMLGADVRHIFGSPKLSRRATEPKIFDDACVAIKDLHPQWPLQLIGSPLSFSIAACSFTGIAALLRLGADPLAPIHSSDQDNDRNRWTPLHLAVKYHSSELLVLLLLGLPKHEADLDAAILTSVKARLARIPYLSEILGGKKSPLAKALTRSRVKISFTNLWDATIGCALSYSAAAERIAIHGAARDERLAEIIALLPSSCLFLNVASGKTPLMQAIDFNDLPVVVALLKRFPPLASKAFLDPLDGQFTFPIHFAAQIASRRDAEDSIDIMKALSRSEANLMSLRDSRGKSPLHYSVTGSSDRATKWLIDRGCSISATDDQGQSPLHSVQSTKNLVALLDAGSFANQQDKSGKAAIHTAVSPGSEELVKILADRGADLNIQDNLGQTALHYAVLRRSRDVCAVLLDAGANANVQAQGGDTPLHLAIQSTRSDIVKLLLDKGADITVRDIKSSTLLHQSVITGDLICFNWILAFMQRHEPALINAIDVKKQSPLHIAAKFARVSMAEKLLQQGAMADMADDDGNTAFHLAVLSDPSLGHTQADKVDFLALLYTHWTSTCGPDVSRTDLITSQLNTENVLGKTAWDLAYAQKSFMVMEFLIAKGGFPVCRQLHMDGEYIGNQLLDCAVAAGEWDAVITLLRHHSVIEMHPMLKRDAPPELYIALRMNDKEKLREYLKQ